MLRNDLNHGERAAGGGARAGDRRACAETTRNGRFDDMQRVRHAHEHDPSPHSEAVSRENTHKVRNLARAFLQIAYRPRPRWKKKPARQTAGGTRRIRRNPAPPITCWSMDSPATVAQRVVDRFRVARWRCTERRVQDFPAARMDALPSAVSPVCCTRLFQRHHQAPMTRFRQGIDLDDAPVKPNGLAPTGACLELVRDFGEHSDHTLPRALSSR